MAALATPVKHNLEGPPEKTAAKAAPGHHSKSVTNSPF
jgi:hypothetical protein